MIPVIALVGRPNVGKSTLFNQLTRSRDALVANFSGLTRDRKYGESIVGGRKTLIIDTGGVSGEEEGIDAEMARQSMLAIEEADAVVFIVDAKAGVTAADDFLLKKLRVVNKPFYLVANKIDGVNPDIALAEFYSLGIETVLPATASHGKGVAKIMETVLAGFPEEPDEDVDLDDENKSIRVGIVGRPNVGKSTLVNRILGEERVVVFDEPGTTRDSIYIDFEREDKHYTLIDTAGVRRRKNIKETVEKFSIIKTLQAIEDAHVVVLVLDAKEGLVDQDMHLIGYILETGRAFVLAVNKWDGMSVDDKQSVKAKLDRKLGFVDYVDIHFISALHGTGVGHLYKSVNNAYQSAWIKPSTNQLTTLLEKAVFDHPPPMIQGRRIKLRYAHLGGSNPPRIIIHGNQTEKLLSSYLRYLERFFRDALKIQGTPIKIELRSGENPYAGQKNKLTPRQEFNRRRLMSYVKKSDKKRKYKKTKSDR